jgi:hypothetical protein
MASLVSARITRTEQSATYPYGVAPEGVAQHKLNRLLELRAAIDSLRSERESHDPLLSWVLEQQRAGASATD